MTAAIYTMTDNTWAILAGQEYVRRFVKPKSEGLVSLLASDVFLSSIRIGPEIFGRKLKGKANVERFFYDHILKTAGRPGLRKTAYKPIDTGVRITCEINEDALVEGVLRRCRKKWVAQLIFRKEANDATIAHICEESFQDEVALSPASAIAVNATKAMMLAQRYINRYMKLKEKEFYDLLTADIHMRFTITENLSSSVQELRGKTEVEKVFHETFFLVASHFNLTEISYEYINDDDGVLIRGIMDEDKVESQAINRYSKLFSVQLKVRKEEGVLKIRSIWESHYQNLIYMPLAT